MATIDDPTATASNIVLRGVVACGTSGDYAISAESIHSTFPPETSKPKKEKSDWIAKKKKPAWRGQF